MFNQNKTQRKEQQIVKIETTTAKQIKNTFTDVTEIKFSERYDENKLTGYTEVMVTISNSYGESSYIGVGMSKNNKSSTLRSYAGKAEFEKGVTENEIKVIFSNESERNL